MSADFEVWLVISDADGVKEPYEMVGGASSLELAEALRDASISLGYDAVILGGASRI